MDNCLNLAVLFGGRSPEHEISCKSAEGVLSAVNKGKYRALAIRIEKSGKWTYLSANGPSEVWLPPTPGGSLIQKSDYRVVENIDVVFPVLHGALGEDGTVQGLLEMAELPYVGCGVRASAIALDKPSTKVFLKNAGLPLAPYMVVNKQVWQSRRAEVFVEIEERLGLPCFVKPASLGSSIGVSKVKQAADISTAMDLAAQYDSTIVIEKAIEKARELEVSVVGCEDPRASVVGEVLHQHDFLSYTAKYQDKTTRVEIPASLTEQTASQLRKMAVDGFLALGCDGLARIDFLVQEDGEIYLLEVNTMPGMPVTGMTPRLWGATGVSYEALVDWLVTLALHRHEQRKEHVKTL